VQDSSASIEDPAPASGLPAGFFDDPSKAPAPETSQSPTGDTALPPPEDDEMAAFEAFLAQEEPQASTSSAGPTTFSAQATISAGEVLFNSDPDGEQTANGNGAEEEDDDDEPKESEEERLAREEREELMERIEQ
jgi:zinc finger protein 830